MSRFSNYQSRFRSNQLTHLLQFNIYLKVLPHKRFELSVSKMILSLLSLTYQIGFKVQYELLFYKSYLL